MGNKLTKISKNFSRVTIDVWGNKTTANKIRVLDSHRIGADDPQWKAKIASGQGATNYMYAYRKWQNFRPSRVLAMYTQYSLKGKTMFTEHHHPLPEDIVSNIPGGVLTAATNEAAMRILRKIESEASTFSGLPLLGELRNTAGMIRKPAEALAGLLNRALEKKQKYSKRYKGDTSHFKGKGLVNTAGRSWLEGVFGWAPLVQDIEGIAEATLRRYEDIGIKRVIGVGKGEWSHSSVEDGGSNNYQQYYYNREVIGSIDVKYVAGLQTNVQRSNNALERVIENSQTDWNDLVPAAWELLPWSFLVDYFGNIGDVLTAASVSRANVVWSAKTVRSSQEVRTTGLSFENVSSSTAQLSSELGFASSIYRVVERGAAPIANPQLRFELPGRRGQLLNISALLAARLRF